jgi:hypothetical protein
MPLPLIHRRLRDLPKSVAPWLPARIVANRRHDAITLAALPVTAVKFWRTNFLRKVLTIRLDCEFDNEAIQAGGGQPSGAPMQMLATSPGSAGGDMPSAQRMERFELRYDYGTTAN